MFRKHTDYRYEVSVHIILYCEALYIHTVGFPHVHTVTVYGYRKKRFLAGLYCKELAV